MAHPVKCYYCGIVFDRDKNPYVQVNGRRYAHKECSLSEDEKRTQEDKDKIDMEEYIKSLLNITCLGPRINKQIKAYREEYNYTYSGIHKSLKYFYEVKNNDVSKANGGIGIVPYIYKQAHDYYYALWEAQQKNENKIEIIEEYVPKVKEIVIPRPVRKPKTRELFTFLDKDE